MKIVTALPIYRNRFQKPALFFSSHNFSVGTLIFAPNINKKEKPAVVLEVAEMKDLKTFIRKNKVLIDKITNSFQIQLLSKEIITDIQTKGEKIKFPIQETFEKLISKKIIKELNQFSENSDSREILKNLKTITPEFISKKLIRFLPSKKENGDEKIIGRNTKSIGDLLSRKKSVKKSLHSEKHYLVDEIRNYFNETATKGKGSFSFYLGFFKRIPEATIYQYWAEVKESRLPTKAQQKIFWWKIGKHLKK